MGRGRYGPSGGSGFASWRCSVTRSGSRCAHPAGRRRPGIRGDHCKAHRCALTSMTRLGECQLKDECCVNSKCDSGQVCRLN